MRDALAPLDGQRLRFVATFARTGARPVFRRHTEPTVLLTDLADTPTAILCDHLWMGATRGLAALGVLDTGDRLAFDARVAPYPRRHGGIDYGLARPTRFVVLPALEPILFGGEPVPQAVPIPAPVTVPAEPLPTKNRDLLATLEALTTERGAPPSLVRLYSRLALSPLGYLHRLNELAQRGALTLTPTGHILATTEGSLSC